MRIISDVTGKEYKTVEECLAAEKEYREAELVKKAHQKELDEAYDAAMAAIDHYFDVAGVEIKETPNGFEAKYTAEIDRDKADEIFEEILTTFLNF